MDEDIRRRALTENTLWMVEWTDFALIFVWRLRVLLDENLILRHITLCVQFANRMSLFGRHAKAFNDGLNL